MVATLTINVGARQIGGRSLALVSGATATATRDTSRIVAATAAMGNTAGIDRVSAGMRMIGQQITRTLDRVEHIKPLLGSIAGATTLAGIDAMVDRWAKTGQNLANLSYRLNMPVETIGNIRGALDQVGGIVSDADAGMRGLQETLSSASWGRSVEAIQAFKDLRIAIPDARKGEKMMAVQDALDQLSVALEGKTADAQARALARVGITGDAWLKALGHGPTFWRELQSRASRTGGVMTAAMVHHADEMSASWQRLTMAVSGVRNRLIDKYSPWITGFIDRLTPWIARMAPMRITPLETISRKMFGRESRGSSGRGAANPGPVADTTMNPARASFLETLSAGESRSYTSQNPHSSAWGRYQFIQTTDAAAKRESGITGDDPVSQDRRAWFWAAKIYRQRTGRDLERDWTAGEYESVAHALRDEWPSMPGGSQSHGLTMQTFIERAAANKARHTAPDGSAPVVIGDSIAAGIGRSRHWETHAEVGKGPSWVLNQIIDPDLDVRGKDVVLSSGASNDPGSASLVQQQIEALRSKGARTVRVVGVGDRPDLDGVNETLRRASEKAGGQFTGPLHDLSPDHIHPRNYYEVVGGPTVEVRIHDAPPGSTGDIKADGAVIAAPLVVN